MTVHWRRAPAPAPGGRAYYMSHAEACLVAAAAAPDPGAAALHAEEYSLWLMLAEHRQAINEVVRRYGEDAADAL